MQSRIRTRSSRCDVCFQFSFLFSIAVVPFIAVVWFFLRLEFRAVFELSTYSAGMRFITTLVFPLIGVVCASNGKHYTNSTKYAVKTPPLTTPWTYQVGTDPWPEYPRPQLERSEWSSLNGVWTYQNASSLEAVNSPPFNQTLTNKVLIPSCLESGISGQYKSSSEKED